MTEPLMPDEAKAEVLEETRRHLAAFVRLIGKWPNFRRHVACGFLGAAIAEADKIGVDVEGFLAHIRAKEPRPAVLAPNPKARS
jgi:hypothetical protein